MSIETSNNDKNIGKKAFKAGAWYTVSTISVKAITVLTTPIVTRMMTTSEYGVASNFTSWYALLHILCSLDLTMSIGRAKLDYPKKLNEFIGSLQLLSALTTIVVCTLGLVFLEPVSKAMEMNVYLLLILAIYLLLAPAVNFAQTRYRYEYRYKENILITMFITCASTICTVFLVWMMRDNRYYGKVIGTAFPTCLLALYYWYVSIKAKEVKVNIQYWKYALAISLPMLVHTISLNLLATSDRVLITKICGTSDTGIYTLGYQYAILINIVMTAVNQAWQPWFHDNYFVGNYKLIKEKAKRLIILGCFIGIGCISIAPEAIFVLGSKNYSDGVLVVAPVALGIVCQFLYSNFINIELHLKKTKYASIGTVIAAFVNVVLNIIFIPVFGFVAAAYTTLVSYVLLMAIHYVITRYVLKVNLYDNKFIVLAFVITCILSYVLTILYDYLLLRLIMICVIGIVFLFINKDYIEQYIKRLQHRKNN